MTYFMSEDQSIAYLEGGWDAYDVEERILEDLIQREVTEPVAVVLSDRSATAFYVATGEII
jgi:hypothetical protein